MKRLSLALAALMLSTAQPAFAQYAVNLRDADVRAYAEDAARVTGMTIVVDSRVNQKVTVSTPRAMSKSEYFEVFLSTLRANGLVAVPISGGYRIQPLQGAATQPSRAASRSTNQNEFITDIIRLRNAEAADALETVRPLVSSQGSVTANKSANSLVIADFADNVARIRGLLNRIDGQGAIDATTTRLVYLQNIGPREVASALAPLLGTNSNVAIGAVDSSGAVAIRGEATAVARFAAMAEELDARAGTGTEVRVYWLEHADAAQLLPVLQQLVGQPVTSESSAPAFIEGQEGEGTGAGPAAPAAASAMAGTMGGNGIVRSGPAVVTRYPGTNAVIIAANATAQRQLGEVIRQLDTRREQVLVEAIIVEIGDNAARQLGVQFLLAGKNSPFAATNWSNVQPQILPLAGAYANYELGRETSVSDNGTVTTTYDSPLGQGVTDAAVQSVLRATGGFAGGVAEIGKNMLFGAIVNAVKSDTASNILSTPSITTLDNQEAKLLVGQEVPVTTGEALSTNFDNAFRTVQRQNVGIQLDVKPQVNSSGSIKLFIRQEVSSVAGPVSSRSSDLVINKREFKTVLTVDNGDIVALGGLLDENERRTIEKIPLLGDIPLLGELFKSRSRSKTKTNLMVFIRPTLVRTREDARAIAAARYGYVRADQQSRNPDVEPSLDMLVRDYLGTTPPSAQPMAPGDKVFQPALPAPATSDERRD